MLPLKELFVTLQLQTQEMVVLFLKKWNLKKCWAISNKQWRLSDCRLKIIFILLDIYIMHEDHYFTFTKLQSMF